MFIKNHHYKLIHREMKVKMALFLASVLDEVIRYVQSPAQLPLGNNEKDAGWELDPICKKFKVNKSLLLLKITF